MPLLETKGAASAQGFGEFAKVGAANYIEDVFSCFLYSGNGSTQTITNGIDLSTKGGMVWIKPRTDAASGENGHSFYDTLRGVKKVLRSNTTAAQNTLTNDGLTAFNATGFSVSDDSFGSYGVNGPNARTFVSWTFRKQAKFFDVVTYTGNGSSSRAINHSLESVPGCVIVKSTSNNREWRVWHRSLSFGQFGYLSLNLTSAETFGGWGGANTSTQFYVSNTDITGINASGETYVAYLFAHDAGGFGLTGTDNVISCGSFTIDGGGIGSVTLGYEPQWVLAKVTNTTGDWRLLDNMRGWTNNSGGNQQGLLANTSAAEATPGWGDTLSSTGFNMYGTASDTYIYIAIRRGPMKTPTTGTSVFDPEAYTGTSATRTITSGFPVDLSISKIRSQSYPGGWFDRLRGALQVIRSSSTDAEATSANSLTGFDSMTGVILGSDPSGRINTSPDTYAMWNFRRAPGFFDVVCYTGTGANRTVSHNLGVVPELMIVKYRDNTSNWTVYSATLANTEYILLNSNGTKLTGTTRWNSTTPTSSVFTVGTDTGVNDSGGTYVAYLFASAAGVSKIGSYTGNGTSQTINCGFTSGARFVLIKKTSGNGNWWVWDSARGIVAGNDPYLALNSTSAEGTSYDSVDADSSGFIVNDDLGTGINASGSTYLFLAIA